MTPHIQEKLTILDSFENIFKDLSEQMISPGQKMYPLDMLAIGVINRSLSLIAGFTTLIKHGNYIASAHLVRLHLDNYLRFHAAWLVPDPHDFAHKIMNGARIDKLKDKTGKNLRDNYLVEKSSVDYPWIENVYKETSGFIHLSKKHIFTSTIVKDKEEASIEFCVSKEDKYVTDESRYEASECMIEITNCIIHLLEGWIWTKNNSEKL